MGVLDLGQYGPRIPFGNVRKTAVVKSVEGLGLLMSDVVGLVAYHGGYQSGVCHEYDVGGFSLPIRNCAWNNPLGLNNCRTIKNVMVDSCLTP